MDDHDSDVEPLRAVLSQHFAAAYGDWTEELTDHYRLLDIEMVVDR